MIRIIADDAIPFLEGVLEPYADIRYLPWNRITRKEVSGADALLIRTRTKCDKELLNGSSVRFIATATIGTDHIDTRYCDAAGIRWASAPGCNAASVQQYVASALFTLSAEKKIVLPGKTLGIIGVGNVGSKVEKLAGILGMKCLLNDPPRERAEGPGKFVPLATLLHGSDIVTLHVPLNREGEDKTFHFFGEVSFGNMRKGSWFINTSRGEAVQTPALKDALKSGLLAGALLDVWENEPEADRILMDAAFLATPHIAGYSLDGKANGTTMVVRALGDHFGLPLSSWTPHAIPPVPDELISMDGAGMNTMEILREAVLHTYRVREDDRRFRSDPASFEKLRKGYPIRREFPGFTINLVNGTDEALSALAGLGFRIQPTII